MFASRLDAVGGLHVCMYVCKQTDRSRRTAYMYVYLQADAVGGLHICMLVCKQTDRSGRGDFIYGVAPVSGLNGFPVFALMAGQILQGHHASPLLNG